MNEYNTENDALGLGMDLSGVDTNRPVLPEASYILEVKDVKVEQNKKQTGRNLVVEFMTTSDCTDATGARVIGAGYTILKYYPLQQSDNPKAPDFQADLARLQDAVEGPESRAGGAKFQPFNYVGAKVMAKLKIRNDEQYGPSNEIGRLDFVPAEG